VARRDSISPAADASLDNVLGSSAKSGTEVTRERGAAEFEKTVKALAQAAEVVDVEWQRYRSACSIRNSYTASYGRQWFGIWADRTMQGSDAAPGCGVLLKDILTVSGRIDSTMQHAAEDARRADVYPGTRRDIRRKYSMDWPGWDK
jgi:hypothetical protein